MQLRWITGAVWLIIGVPLLIMNLTKQPMIGLEPGPLTLMIGIGAVLLGLFRLGTAAMMRRYQHLRPDSQRQALALVFGTR